VRKNGELPVEEIWLYGSLLDPVERAPNDVDLCVAYPEEDYLFLNEATASHEVQKFKNEVLNGLANVQLDIEDTDTVHRANLVVQRPTQREVKKLVWKRGDTTKKWQARVRRAVS
jgi:hypothetical protein